MKLAHQELQVIEYYIRYGNREPWKATPRPIYDPPKCGVPGCEGKMPFFNIGFFQGTFSWRCLSHIPPDITFPVSLYGEEWNKTGRK